MAGRAVGRQGIHHLQHCLVDLLRGNEEKLRKIRMGGGEKMLFNHCHIGFFVPLKGQNLRRAGVCFLCGEMTRSKV